MKRKFRIGSMQLSIEAIIILVIAIVLLGLGIAFIKNFFAKGSDVLLGKFDPLKEECDVNSNNPILPKEFQLKQGDTISANICAFNNDDKDVTDGVVKLDGCIDPTGATAATPPITINSLKQTIQRGRSAGYKTTISTTSSTKLGTWICNVKVAGTTTGGQIGSAQVSFVVN